MYNALQIDTFRKDFIKRFKKSQSRKHDKQWQNQIDKHE